MKIWTHLRKSRRTKIVGGFRLIAGPFPPSYATVNHNILGVGKLLDWGKRAREGSSFSFYALYMSVCTVYICSVSVCFTGLFIIIKHCLYCRGVWRVLATPFFYAHIVNQHCCKTVVDDSFAAVAGYTG